MTHLMCSICLNITWSGVAFGESDFPKMNKSSYLQNTYYPGSFYRYLIHKNILELSLQYDFNNIQIKKKM